VKTDGSNTVSKNDQGHNQRQKVLDEGWFYKFIHQGQNQGQNDLDK
jgi:hypothetical protein